MSIINNTIGHDYLLGTKSIDANTKEEIKKLNEELKANHQGSKLELKEEDFLRILTTQLKTQDPTNPIDDKAFVSQMAQLTSLKELNNLNNNILSLVSQNSINSSIALISKQIEWIEKDSGQPLSAKVIGVRLNESGEVFLKTDKGIMVSLKEVIEVK